ncbi:hypothetical protein ACIHFD_47510 [Nonomuraea sp. NPDC051941]|uniref:hypothetical protein n=1 Tax=Nonomuraea sp. NPDC051941 TaxID=3364373 RepID=UPI0037C50CC8
MQTHKLLDRMTGTTGVDLTRERVSDRTAAEHHKILAKLRGLLVKRGMHARAVEWFKLTLQSGGLHRSSGWNLDRYAPELLVFGPQGRRVATIRIAARSKAYIVDIAQVGENNEIKPDERYVIPPGYPAKAAALIPGFLSETP